MSDLINCFKLDAAFDAATASTHELVQTSNGAPFRRPTTVVKKWKRRAELGRGAAGTVCLEHDEESKELRAVKQISKGRPSLPFMCNPERELLAPSQVSKVSQCEECFGRIFGESPNPFIVVGKNPKRSNN